MRTTAVSYPEGWEAVSDCGQFGPALVEEPEPATDEWTGAVSAYVDAVPYPRAASPSEGEIDRAVTAIAGLQAVRVRAEADGDGLRPDGTEIVRWLVDLGIGADDGAGTLVLDAVDSTATGVRFARVVDVADAMARSLEPRIRDEPAEETVVARYEGGGAPFTIAAAPAATRPSTCLRLVDADGIACVQGVDATGVALTALETPAGPVTAGIAGPEIDRVELRAGDPAWAYLPVPYPGWDSRAFAVPLDPEGLTSVRLLDGRARWWPSRRLPRPADRCRERAPGSLRGARRRGSRARRTCGAPARRTRRPRARRSATGGSAAARAPGSAGPARS